MLFCLQMRERFAGPFDRLQTGIICRRDKSGIIAAKHPFNFQKGRLDMSIIHISWDEWQDIKMTPEGTTTAIPGLRQSVASGDRIIIDSPDAGVASHLLTFNEDGSPKLTVIDEH